MVESVLNPPLSNIQLELLKLYSTNVSDETLVDLKKTMAKFFLDRLRKNADNQGEKEGYSDSFFKTID